MNHTATQKHFVQARYKPKETINNYKKSVLNRHHVNVRESDRENTKTTFNIYNSEETKQVVTQKQKRALTCDANAMYIVHALTFHNNARANWQANTVVCAVNGYCYTQKCSTYKHTCVYTNAWFFNSVCVHAITRSIA